MNAVSESGGGGVAEPARPGRTGDAECSRGASHHPIPTRERKVDFFGGVVAMAEGRE